jgi:hypothetical protein
MVRALLVRGLLCGLLAGAAAGAVAFVLGEPQVARAVRVDAAFAHAHGAAHEHALVARGVQRTAGLATGTLFVGAALGGLLALAFATAYGRVGRLGARATAALLAAGAFVCLTLVPALAYPPSPPGVGDPATIRARTALFGVAIAIALLAAWAAARTARGARARGWDVRAAGLLACLTFAGLAALGTALLPGVDEVPRGYPPDLLVRFRLASLATSATLWAALGVAFGTSVRRLLERRPAPGAPERVPAV